LGKEDRCASEGTSVSSEGTGQRMSAARRRELIERLVEAQGAVHVEELARSWDVTASTIRRDLSLLTEQGKLARTYGGAMAAAGPAEPSVEHRATLSVAEKERIANWAAARVGEGDTVILDAGTTTGRLAQRLRAHTNLTVITNGITSITELADAEGVEVVALGGALRHISHGFVGPLAELTLSRLTADKVFLGADGLDARWGICEASLSQTRLKELMMARAAEIYVLADSSKLGQAPFTAWAPLERPWTLVTDTAATDEQLADFRALAHTQVVLV